MYGDQYMVLPIMHYRWSFPENYEKFVFYNFGHMAAPQLLTEDKIEFGNMLGMGTKQMKFFHSRLSFNPRLAETERS